MVSFAAARLNTLILWIFETQTSKFWNCLPIFPPNSNAWFTLTLSAEIWAKLKNVWDWNIFLWQHQSRTQWRRPIRKDRWKAFQIRKSKLLNFFLTNFNSRCPIWIHVINSLAEKAPQLCLLDSQVCTFFIFNQLIGNFFKGFDTICGRQDHHWAGIWASWWGQRNPW